MVHYICTGGCKGVSDSPGVCRAVDCPDHGKALKPCDCEDGTHAALGGQPAERKEENEKQEE
jgi:hypothetical protein